MAGEVPPPDGRLAPPMGDPVGSGSQRASSALRGVLWRERAIGGKDA